MHKQKVSNIVVVVGAYPDVGKGIFTASLGYLLQESGYQVSPIKFDGYINTSSGAMNPYHGLIQSKYSEEEVFVLEDGYEADADSGYYERFLDKSFSNLSNITNGRLFSKILSLEKEKKLRQGEVLNYRSLRGYLSKWILEVANSTEILLVEVGGTIGDKENEIIFDTLNKIKSQELAKIHTIMLSPYFNHLVNDGLELSYRTKITRQAFEKSWRLGLMPQSIVMRNSITSNLEKNDLDYIALETGLDAKKGIYIDPNCKCVYEVPEILAAQNLHINILDAFGLKYKKSLSKSNRLKKYLEQLTALDYGKQKVLRVGIFGKSVSDDTYVSLKEAIQHAAVVTNQKVEIVWLDDSTDYENDLKTIHTLIIGEGLFNIKEKIKSLSYARKNSIPCLALSFGFDLLVKEYCEKVLHSPINVEEIKNTAGAKIKKTNLMTGSIKIIINNSKHYSATKFKERIRNNSELTKEVVDILKNSDLKIAAIDISSNQPVILELQHHPFFVGVKFHPEFLSHPMKPHQLFVGLLKAVK
jgi:CTP synthase